MNRLCTLSASAALASILLSATLSPGTAVAVEPAEAVGVEPTEAVVAAPVEEKNPLRFYQGSNNSYLQATFQAELALFDQNNSWFGKAKENLGENSDSWWESTLRPGIEGSFFFTNDQEIYGRLDAVQANTGGGYDAAGSNVGLGDVTDLRVENAYAGWRSGNMFPSLGKDFLDISFGRQQYIVGNGFLFYNEEGAGGARGAYWIGGRRVAEYAGIARLKTGNWSGNLVYFESDPLSGLDTQVGGATVDYNSEEYGSLGGGMYTVTSDIDSRDAMNIFNIRGGIKPFAASNIAGLKPLKLEGEYVYEDRDNDLDAGNGWYLAASYQFEQVAWQPSLTYRYASFDENYDSMFYGASDWGTWFQGEILGEYALGNSNLDSHMVKLKVQPIEPVTVNLIYYHFNLHDAAAFGVQSDDYADEFDLIIDWAVNKHLTLSLVGAIAEPDDGATQHTGGDDTWSYAMLYGSIKF